MLAVEQKEQRPLTTLLGHGHHGVMADQAGDERQRAGPQVLYHGRHERPRQSLLKSPAGRRVLSFVAVRDDDIGDPLISEANGGQKTQWIRGVHIKKGTRLCGNVTFFNLKAKNPSYLKMYIQVALSAEVV